MADVRRRTALNVAKQLATWLTPLTADVRAAAQRRLSLL